MTKDELREKALELADDWKGEFWKSGVIYALVYIGDQIEETKPDLDIPDEPELVRKFPAPNLPEAR